MNLVELTDQKLLNQKGKFIHQFALHERVFIFANRWVLADSVRKASHPNLHCQRDQYYIS